MIRRDTDVSKTKNILSEYSKKNSIHKTSTAHFVADLEDAYRNVYCPKKRLVTNVGRVYGSRNGQQLSSDEGKCTNEGVTGKV